jgi:LPPG:FO 2-phospho-L-lactate transferase
VGDTFATLGALSRLGEPTWFQLGDRDIATHLVRSERLHAGWTLARVTAHLARAHGVRTRLLPMTNDRVRTFVHTQAGRLAFQDYLVRRRGRGHVRRIEFVGAAAARPAPGVLAALRTSHAIVLPPSNPLVSIGPILALRGVRQALRQRRDHVVAVSPLVAGRPLKGPLHRMLRGLGHEVSPRGVARLYADVAGTFVLDVRDRRWRPAIEALGMRVVVTDTVMRTRAHAARLAAAALAAIEPPAS